jgi:hypothetical protein
MWPFSRRKFSVSLLNRDWSVIQDVIKVVHVPRRGEIIYIDSVGYLQVVNIVHNIQSKQGIFVIVEKIDKTDIES